MADNNIYFDGDISEFVDWFSGDNSITEENDTGNKQASGKAIRRLIQSHLQKPVYIYNDEAAGKIRFFSSQLAKDKWYEDPDKYPELLLGQFDAVSGYTVELYEDAKGEKPLTNLASIVRYVKLGDTASEANVFRAYYKVFSLSGDHKTEYPASIYAQARISNDKFTPNPVGNNFDYGGMIELDFTSSLYEGTNTINLDINVRIDKNKVFTAPFTFKINVVNLVTTVNYALENTPYNILQFTAHVENSTDKEPTIEYKIDDGNIVSQKVDTYAANIPIDDLSQGSHILQVRSSVEGNDANIYSNLVYIKFVKYDENKETDLTAQVSIKDGDRFILADTIPTIVFDQYQQSKFKWAFATVSSNAQRRIVWMLKQQGEGDTLIDKLTLFDADQIDNSSSHELGYKPVINGDNYVLIGYIQENVEGVSTLVEKTRFNVIINESKYLVAEATGYDLKLENTTGFSNDIISNRRWRSNYNNLAVNCLFNRVSDEVGVVETPPFPWNTQAGWEGEAMHLSPGHYVHIPYKFFRLNNADIRNSGATIEIEFKFRSATNMNDEIIVIGGGENKSKIAFTPNSAYLYSDGNTLLVKTNFKTDERIKVAFIINQSSGSTDPYDNGLAMIVNNGILERVSNYSESFTSEGEITIGKEGAGAEIFIYRIRAWHRALSPEELFQDYAIDSNDTADIAINNDILYNRKVSYDKIINKLPIVFIDGDITRLLSPREGKEINSCVSLAKIDMMDTEKNMYINKCRIRKHGQSTLNYPVPSFKIWSNSEFYVNDQNSTYWGQQIEFKKDDAPNITNVSLGQGNIPSADTSKTFPYNKNRYQMKDKAVPANKWVLQANYADSSGVHNGGIMRLIQESLYNALVEINGRSYYKLRTIPQLIASINANRDYLDENDFYATEEDKAAYSSWNSNQAGPKNCMYEYITETVGNTVIRKVKLWRNQFDSAFPYTLRIAPDSFPCVVFYRKSKTGEEATPIFLGQYVFMDDKKSDFVYGERSIYKVENDPFCFLFKNADKDTKNRRLWNNKNCLRIEVTMINNDLVRYKSHYFNNHRINEIVTTYKKDPNNEYYVDENGNRIQDSELEERGVKIGRYPNWYNGFQLVYPDLEITDKEFEGYTEDQFAEALNERASSFLAFHDWVVSTYEYFVAHEGTQSDIYGNTNYNYEQVHPGFQKFINEAEQHLNLYLCAAYYIFFLRFGLVDSIERNAQLKTYDGVHWHYEPWDMDIALGNQNTGGIKWNPPMTRTTNDRSSAAYSGVSVNSEGVVTGSNWLWDALESWPHWRNEIVRSVAQALSQTLTYDYICKVLDEEYAAKWCERLYNLSGHFKYIESGRLHAWLQGSRTSHRHWWLKTSMDYYDAAWICGDYRNTGAYVNIKYRGGDDPKTMRKLGIYIEPANNGYFCYASEIDSESVIDDHSLVAINAGTRGCIIVDRSNNLDPKQPFHIYGANNIKKLDLTDVYYETAGTGGIRNFYFSAFTDTFKELNVGVPLALLEQGITNGEGLAASYSSDATERLLGTPIAQRSLEVLNIQGCMGGNTYAEEGGNQIIQVCDYNSFLNNTEKLRRLYALATKMTSFISNNYRDENNNIQYRGGHYEVLQLPSTITSLEFHDSSWAEYDNNPIPTNSLGLSFWSYENNHVENVPFEQTDIKTLRLLGNTLRNECAIKLLKAFIAKAIADTGHTGDYSLEIENINLTDDYYEDHSGFSFDYNDLVNMSQLNNGNNAGINYKGYIFLSTIGTSVESEINERIQFIKNKFGPSVFTRSSDKRNLVVDFDVTGGSGNLFITLSGNGYDEANDCFIPGYAEDGKQRSVNVAASRFVLPDVDDLQQLLQIKVGSTYTSNLQGAKAVYTSDDLILYLPELKRDSQGNLLNSLTLFITDNSIENSQITKEITKPVVNKAYPDYIRVEVIDDDNYNCFTKLDENVIDNIRQRILNVSVRTKECNIKVTPVYSDPSADKVTINDIDVILKQDSTSNFTLEKKSFNESTNVALYRLSYNNTIESAVSAVICNAICNIKYKSGDTYDDFDFKFSFFKDDVVVTHESNPQLHSALNALNVGCMTDSVGNKVYTASSLKGITHLTFYDVEPQSTASSSFAALTSFNVDLLDPSKGSIFAYLDPNILETINLDGCINPSLETNTTTINLSAFTKLTSFTSASNAKINFTFAPASECDVLGTVTIGNANELVLKNATNASLVVTVAGITYLDIENLKLNKNNLSLTIDNANLSGLIFKDTIKSNGSIIWGYLTNYLNSASPNIAGEIHIDLNWSTKFKVSLASLKSLRDYTASRGTDQITLDGNVFTDYHTVEVKDDIDRYFEGLISSGDWGLPCIEISPTSLHEYVAAKADPANHIVSSGTLGRLTTKSIYSRSPNTGDKGYPATAAWDDDKNQVTDLTWFKYIGGDKLTQYEKWDEKFPNVDYLYWPSNGGVFDTEKGASLKSKVIITNYADTPKCDATNESSDVYYKLLLIPKTCIDAWYNSLDASNVFTGANAALPSSDTEGRIAALKTKNIISNEDWTLEYLKGLTTSQLSAMLSNSEFNTLTSAQGYCLNSKTQNGSNKNTITLGNYF